MISNITPLQSLPQIFFLNVVYNGEPTKQAKKKQNMPRRTKGEIKDKNGIKKIRRKMDNR